jgi:uncharacterized protein YodC (DUF2158 family)
MATITNVSGVQSGREKMADQIKKGHVVKPKSGGPRMWVEKVLKDTSGKPTAWCTWFEGSKPQYATFDPDALEIARWSS